MGLATVTNSQKQREIEGRRALGIARAMKVLRHARLLLTSVEAVKGMSRSLDGDVRMLRTAVEQMDEWAQSEGLK